MTLSDQQIREFRDALYRYYDQHGRHDLPWRQTTSGTLDPYHIVVSELMLQQTQVGRVIPKFEHFIQSFPDFQCLAAAGLGEVLTEWQGLGYNRRAKFLWQLANDVAARYNGVLPAELAELVALPGIGKNTAGAICAYAWDKPALFVETNIRTVYFHHFFADRQDIDDKEVLEVLAQTIDTAEPRQFYWALMDYGTHLKATIGKNIHRSKHYTKQSKFEGSKRQIRGRVIRLLTAGPATLPDLADRVEDERLSEVLQDLLTEGLVVETDKDFRLA